MKIIQIAFCGDTGVGKTSIINRFLYDQYDDNGPSTIGAMHNESEVFLNGEEIKLDIWDTAGTEKYSSLIPSFFRDSDVIVIVYDVTDENTFNKLNYWLEMAKNNSQADPHFIIVGNKKDLTNNIVIPGIMLDGFASRIKAYGYFEVSAKSNQGIKDLFMKIASSSQDINNKREEHVTISKHDKKRKGCC